jgi:hypothetical protein
MRQEELALAQMLAPVEDQDRLLAEDGSKRLVCLSGVQVRLIPGEHLADRIGVRDIDTDAEDDKGNGEEVMSAARRKPGRRAGAGRR